MEQLGDAQPMLVIPQFGGAMEKQSSHKLATSGV